MSSSIPRVYSMESDRDSAAAVVGIHGVRPPYGDRREILVYAREGQRAAPPPHSFVFESSHSLSGEESAEEPSSLPSAAARRSDHGVSNRNGHLTHNHCQLTDLTHSAGRQSAGVSVAVSTHCQASEATVHCQSVLSTAACPHVAVRTQQMEVTPLLSSTGANRSLRSDGDGDGDGDSGGALTDTDRDGDDAHWVMQMHTRTSGTQNNGNTQTPASASADTSTGTDTDTHTDTDTVVTCLVRVKRVLILLLVLSIVVLLYFTLVPHLHELVDAIQEMGSAGYVVIALCVAVCGVPPLLFYLTFELGAGFIFQSNYAAALLSVAVGGALGASLGYGVGVLFRDRVTAYTQHHPKLHRVVSLLERDSVKFLCLFRLSFVPFAWFNSVCGTSKIRFPTYLLASIPPMLVQQALVVNVGTTLSSLSKIGHTNLSSHPSGLVLIVLEIAASVLLLAVVALLVKRAISLSESRLFGEPMRMTAVAAAAHHHRDGESEENTTPQLTTTNNNNNNEEDNATPQLTTANSNNNEEENENR